MGGSFLQCDVTIVQQLDFDAILKPKRHNKDIITKAEKYPIEIHYVTSHNGGGWVVLTFDKV